MSILSETLATVPNFLLHLVASFLLLSAFAWAYTHWTPYREIALIRAGNVAAACSLGGALLGFILALATVSAHTSNVLELTLWGLIAGLVQAAVYALVRLFIPDLSKGIEDGVTAQGVLLGLLSIGCGILTGACLTP
ncbi:MAG: DUF350 domain-containing protein [Nitrospiraceae bacterium]|nr:DUF350 domain-containing protein [Nitrospiraceae bacterium]